MYVSGIIVSFPQPRHRGNGRVLHPLCGEALEGRNSTRIPESGKICERLRYVARLSPNELDYLVARVPRCPECLKLIQICNGNYWR